MLGLAAIYAARGDAPNAAAATRNATELRTVFNTKWALAATAAFAGVDGDGLNATLASGERSDPPGGFLRGFQRSGAAVSGWGKTETMFPLIAGLADGGSTQTDAAFTLLAVYANPNTITECRCQMPEALFRYGRTGTSSSPCTKMTVVDYLITNFLNDTY